MRIFFQNVATQSHYGSKTLTVTHPKFIIYGAEAAPRPPLSVMKCVRFAARRKTHEYLDAARFRHGDLSRLDYRNYEGRDAINLGDVAIYQSTAALIKHALPKADILPMNWGELSQYSVKNEDRQKTALIFSGSGYFFLTQNGRLPARIKDDFDWLMNQQIPTFFFGVGLNRPGQSELSARIHVHCLESRCVSNAKNALMQHTRRQFFAYLDVNDGWFPSKLNARAGFTLTCRKPADKHGYPNQKNSFFMKMSS